MVRKVLTKKKLGDVRLTDDLEWWLARPPEERIAAVEFLRRQYHGSLPGLQRTFRIFKLSER